MINNVFSNVQICQHNHFISRYISKSIRIMSKYGCVKLNHEQEIMFISLMHCFVVASFIHHLARWMTNLHLNPTCSMKVKKNWFGWFGSTPKHNGFFSWPMLPSYTKFHENWANRFPVILLTNRQQIIQQTIHDLLGGGNTNCNVILYLGKKGFLSQMLT